MNRAEILRLGAVVVGLGTSMGCVFNRGGVAESPGGGGTGGSGSITFDASPIDTVINNDRQYTTSETGNGDGLGPTADANCGAMNFTPPGVPPDLLIVLDRSGSMNQDSNGRACNGGCGANSKWSQMTTAINQVVLQTQTSINWGLKFFANDNTCGVNPGAVVAPGPNNAAAIASAIAAGANAPGSSTPTRAAETSAGAYMATLTDTNPKFVLLATDGLPNCAAGQNNGAADDAAAIQAVADVQTMGFDTFVVGIATNGMADTTLSQMAVNGKRPRIGTPSYYPVSNTADLVSVLMTIQGVVTPKCDFALSTAPMNADLTNIRVKIGTTTVVPDAVNGWTYGPGMTTIAFHGSSCDQLKMSAEAVQVFYGCGIDPIK